MSTVVDHVCDPAKFHCAYIRKLEFADVLLHSIQLKEPGSYDEFLTREQPASAYIANDFLLTKLFTSFGVQ